MLSVLRRNPLALGLAILLHIGLAVFLIFEIEWRDDFAAARNVAIDAASGDWILVVDADESLAPGAAAELRRIIEFTQGGGEINLIVGGINVGAQPYWNAEATMLMHTKGILVMIPSAAMVLTGKEALDYSGGVSAEDNQGIGGYERIMGPNGQAQYFAHDLGDACAALLRHYEFTYREPGERFGRPAPTDDPSARDIGDEPHGGLFPTVRDVFDEASNPGRKQPFEMRRLMSAVVDRDQPAMERWFGQQGAEIAVTWPSKNSLCTTSSGAMLATLPIVVLTETGTTAPFSAMSGALILISPEGVLSAEPKSLLMASSTFLASKAALGQAARTVRGLSRPAPTATTTAEPARVPFRNDLRCINFPPYNQCRNYRKDRAKLAVL